MLVQVMSKVFGGSSKSHASSLWWFRQITKKEHFKVIKWLATDWRYVHTSLSNTASKSLQAVWKLSETDYLLPILHCFLLACAQETMPILSVLCQIRAVVDYNTILTKKKREVILKKTLVEYTAVIRLIHSNFKNIENAGNTKLLSQS